MHSAELNKLTEGNSVQLVKTFSVVLINHHTPSYFLPGITLLVSKQLYLHIYSCFITFTLTQGRICRRNTDTAVQLVVDLPSSQLCIGFKVKTETDIVLEAARISENVIPDLDL